VTVRSAVWALVARISKVGGATRENLLRRRFVASEHISEQRESDARLAVALRESDGLFSVIHTHAIVSIADRAGKIVDANAAFCRISGWRRDELVGHDHRILDSGVHDRAFWIDLWSTIGAGKPWRGEICNRAKNGALYWEDSIIAPLVASHGKADGYISIRFDITDRMRAEAELHVTNERLALAANSAGLAVWDYDLACNRLDWDDWMYRLFGRERSESFDPTVDWHECIHPDDLALLESSLQQAIDGVKPFDIEYRIRWPSGEVRDLKATAHVIRDARGKAVRVIGVNLDITNSKRSQEAVRQNERFMRIVTENLPGMVAYWTADLRCTFANTAFGAWLGHAGQDLRGRGMSELLGELRFVATLPFVTAALGGSEQRVEQSSLGADGQLHDYWMYYLPDRDGDSIAGVISVLIDVSELRNAQARLEELNGALQERTRQAEQASVAKSAFLSNMSHEIRTPLNAVIGLTYLLELTQLDAEQSEYVGKVKLAGRSLLGVINDVLDLSKIEAGEMAFEQVGFSLQRLLDDLLSVMAVQADAKGIGLTVERRDDLPGLLRGDVTHLHQILTNLLSNAIKFTAHGSVKLTVDTAEQSAARVLLRFAVCDTGIGIAPDVQQSLFTPFTQADASTSRRFGGTGLGLSIVKRLATLMDGEVSLTSIPAVGSEFAVTLPFALELSAPPMAALPLEALVVCDEASYRAELSSTARALGWHVETLDSGAQPLERMRERLAQGTPLDVIVVVWSQLGSERLPSFSSLDVAQTAGLPTLVLVTPDEPEQARAAARDAGLDALVLRMPVSTSALFDAMQRRGNWRADASVHAEDAAANTSRLLGARLLVVDDSGINRELAQRMLEREGARVTVASDGEEAVRCLRAAPLEFDAVLMDIHMPVMDGFEAARRIRQTLGLKSLPILALTAGTLLSERQRAEAAGMDDFITKPCEPREMIRVLTRHLPEVAARAATATIATPPVPVDWPVVDGLDTADSCIRFGRDRALFADVLRQLLDEFGDLEASTPSRAELARRLHKLRGSAGMIGAAALQLAVSDAEETLRHDEPAGRRQVTDRVVTELKRLREFSPPLTAATQDTPRGQSIARSADAHELDELSELLTQRRLDAFDVFGRMSPVLLAELGAERFDAFRTALQALHYETALQILCAAPRETARPSPT
jgi:PAS domain S-box-containing protein